MEITIVGAGALGSICGAYLTKAGRNVTLVEPFKEHRERIKKGVFIDGVRGEITMPLNAVEARDLKLLVGAFAGRKAICLPVCDGRHGNPVLWGASYFAEMMRLSGDVGAKQLISKHSEYVIEVPVASNGIFADVDTPADLARLGASSTAKP